MKKQEGKETLEETLEHYIEEFARDTAIDELRLREVELAVTGLTGKWSGIKAINKARMLILERKKLKYETEGVSRVFDMHRERGDPISEIGAKNIALSSPQYLEIIESITNLTVLIEYFDSCEYNIRKKSFDIKNYIETVKLEEG